MRYNQLTEAKAKYDFRGHQLERIPEGLPDVVKHNMQFTENPLESLVGCPQKVVGNFTAQHTLVRDLEGSPREITGSFNMGWNKHLASFKGCPDKVGSDFLVYGCPNMTSFEGFTTKVGAKGTLSLVNTGIKNLKGLPDTLDCKFMITSKDLDSFEGCPSVFKNYVEIRGVARSLHGLVCSGTTMIVEGSFDNLEGLDVTVSDSFFITSVGNPAFKGTSLRNIHKHIKGARNLSFQHVTDSVLGVFLIPGLQTVSFGFASPLNEVHKIVAKHLPKGKAGIMDCQAELLEAGFDEYAQL